MSKIFNHLVLAGLATCIAGTGFLATEAAGFERSYSFNHKKSAVSKNRKKTKRRAGRFDFFGVFNDRPRQNSVDRAERARRVLAAKKFKPITKTKIYRYRADQLVALGDASLKQPGNKVLPLFSDANGKPHEAAVATGGEKLDNSLAQTIFDLLKTSNTATTVTRAQKKAIIAFYKARNYEPLWVDMDGVLPKTLNLLTYLSEAEKEGLTYRDYLPAGLVDYNQDLSEIESNIEDLARLDISLTAKAVRYGQDASGGRIIPNRLSGYHDLKPPRVAAARILKKLAGTRAPEKYLASLHPTHPSYKAFKKMLAELDGTTEKKRYPVIDTAGVIKPGMSDARVELIRQRLVDLGLITSPAQGEDPTDAQKYDEALVAAVKKYQKSKGLHADGIMGRRTLASFNPRKQLNRRKKLVLNMERMRWLPRNFGSKHIFVNQAAFKLQVMQNNRQIWQTRVVVGKPKNQTSFFIDKMRLVVFNPYWGVPKSIISKEMLPRLQANPGYLDQRGFEVYNSRGRKVSSSSIDWYAYGGSSVPFSVRQPPGGRNALGRIKFLFPNKHSIYMHDTPSKSLFSRSTRAFSHGCVRVQNPRQLAENVLGWKRSVIDSKINAGKNSSVKLKQPIPVYLTYFTAWAEPNGHVKFYGDIYGRDRRLDAALNTLAIAQK